MDIETYSGSTLAHGASMHFAPPLRPYSWQSIGVTGWGRVGGEMQQRRPYIASALMQECAPA